MQSKVVRKKVLEAFKAHYSTLASEKRKVSREAVCESASTCRQLLCKVLRERRQSAGLFLQFVKSIEKNISCFKSEDDLGEKFHTRSSFPYFFESAYCHVKHNEVFPVNEKGQLAIADCVDNSRSDKWQNDQNGSIRDNESRPSTAQLTNSNEGRCVFPQSISAVTYAGLFLRQK